MNDQTLGTLEIQMYTQVPSLDDSSPQVRGKHIVVFRHSHCTRDEAIHLAARWRNLNNEGAARQVDYYRWIPIPMDIGEEVFQHANRIVGI